MCTEGVVAAKDPYASGGVFGPTQMWDMAAMASTQVAPVASHYLAPTQPMGTRSEQLPGPRVPIAEADEWEL
eukprot:1278635-Pyramimonas_sp.AAC.1